MPLIFVKAQVKSLISGQSMVLEMINILANDIPKDKRTKTKRFYKGI